MALPLFMRVEPVTGSGPTTGLSRVPLDEPAVAAAICRKVAWYPSMTVSRASSSGLKPSSTAWESGRSTSASSWPAM